MLNMKNVLIFGLALAFFIVGCGQDQGQQTSESVSEQAGTTPDEGKSMIDAAAAEKAALEAAAAEEAEAVLEAVAAEKAALEAAAAEKAEAVLEAAAAEKAALEAAVAEKAEAAEKEAEALDSTTTEKIESLKSDLSDQLNSLGE